MSKFKAGDVVVGLDGSDREILFVGKQDYFYKTIKEGNEYSRSIAECDKYWTIKPKEVTITRENLVHAYKKASANPAFTISGVSFSYDPFAPAYDRVILNNLCKELGLE